MRISSIARRRIAPPHKGMERQWKRCRTCGWTGFYDYIPYGFSNPIMVMGCGHDIDQAESISEAEAVSAINEFEAA